MSTAMITESARVLLDFYNGISQKKVNSNKKNLKLIEDCLKLNNQDESDIKDYMKYWYSEYEILDHLEPDFKKCMREYAGYYSLSPGQKESLKHIDEFHYEYVEQIIPIDDIVISPYDQKKYSKYNKEKMNELVENIKEFGVISPIYVYKTESEYELVSGALRVYASKIAGLKEIPAMVTDKEQADKEFNRVLSKYNIVL